MLVLATAVACEADDADRPGSDQAPPRTSSDWASAPKSTGDLSVLATSDADGFRLRTASGDQEFLPGVNLGSTVPLHQPGEIDVIDAEQYRTWFDQMAELGVRAVRVYTLHPPAFYHELAAHNREHPESPLYLVQGVYLPDESYVVGGTLYDPPVTEAFSAELAEVSDAVHGDLTRPATPGRASGTWTTDVSEWLAAWIIGVEWDPPGLARTDRRHADAAYRPGEFFAATGDATPTERWIATRMDELAGHEAERGVSVPVAMVNWPTTDPLAHPTEPHAYEDRVSVDATHVLPTEAWPGGTFASFHAYPYYPDFLRHEPGLARTRWRGRPDRYAGYLARLRDHHAEHMPLLVTEVGVPSSLGSAHVGTNGRDQGGHTEQEAMAIDADLLRITADQGLGGAFVFSWEDEWFKRTWNTHAHQLHERRQLWHDPLTNEQWFGIVATDPDPVDGAEAEVTPSEGPLSGVRVWADASWVHLEVTGRSGVPDDLLVEADVVPGPEAADHRVRVDPAGGTAVAEVRRALDPIRLDTTERPYRPGARQPWHRYELLVNRALTVGGRRLPAEFQPVGELRRGSWDPAADDYDSLATWQVDEGAGAVRLRIPWPMLGLADPSSRTALGEGVPAELVEVPGIGLSFTTGGETTRLDFAWPTWNHTTYTPRLKAGAGVLADAFADLAP